MNLMMKSLAAVAALLLSGGLAAQAAQPMSPPDAPPSEVMRGPGMGPMGGHGMMGMPEGHPPMDGMHRMMGMGMGMGGGLRLAPMSPRLAGYFGAKAGVLVLKAGNPALKLEDGDVITAIGGRAPTSPFHALRIFHSYEPGEKVPLQVLRDRKSITLEVTVPEHRAEMRRFELRRGGPDAQPAPGAPPPAPPHQH